MPRDTLSDPEIAAILARPKRVALVGASANPMRPSHGVMSFLLARGFDVVPVNPGLAGGTLLGREVFATLAAVPGRIDIVDVFRRSEEVHTVMDETLALDPVPAVVWLQLGVFDAAAVAAGTARGVTVVVNRCPAIEMPRLGLH